MKKNYIIALLFLSIVIASCGDPEVQITDAGYQPKIVVEAYIFAGETVRNIKIARNFRLGQDIDLLKMALTPAENSTVVAINGITLLFDSKTKTYYNDAITIDYGKTYKLTVSTVLDGQTLKTSSETTVPKKGFGIYGWRHLGYISYANDSIELDYTPSDGASFYMFAFLPDSASEFNYIYNNKLFDKVDTAEVKKNLTELRTQYDCVTELSSSMHYYTYQVAFFRLNFYSKYKTMVYAGDVNFKNFIFSASSVQEMDGNFHEPATALNGDGIGVFGSAIKDSVFFILEE